MQEIEDPELAQKRMKEIYKLKGYSNEWIAGLPKRMFMYELQEIGIPLNL